MHLLIIFKSLDTLKIKKNPNKIKNNHYINYFFNELVYKHINELKKIIN